MMSEVAGKKYCFNFKKGTCASLENPQPLDNFKFQKATTDGKVKRKFQCSSCDIVHQQRSKEAARIRQKAWKKNKKDHYRNLDYQKFYGITLDVYNSLFKKQNGCCAICGIHQTMLKRPLAVDHDHVTGKVRGLLCSNGCNPALGLFKDNPDFLKSALSYLRRNS